MKIEDIGEFGLIKRVSEPFLKNLPPEIVQGIGDDCAVIRQSQDSLLLLTTDMLVEDVHFRLKSITPEDLGHKSLAANFSDIAAMAGYPTGSFLSLALPAGFDVEWVDRFYRGYSTLCKQFNAPLLGGNTSRSPGPVIINVCAMGAARQGQVKFRSTAKPGDVICVTGYLGDSHAGLKLVLEDRLCSNSSEEYLLHAHNHPEPHVKEGLFLGRFASVHAMIDLSDGLLSDLARLQESSHAGFAIDLEALPLSGPLLQASLSNGWDPIEMGVLGGEEYCLLFTAAHDGYAELNQMFISEFNRPLHLIGRVTEETSGIIFTKEGKKVIYEEKGFDHFAGLGHL